MHRRDKYFFLMLFIYAGVACAQTFWLRYPGVNEQLPFFLVLTLGAPLVIRPFGRWLGLNIR